MLNWERQGGEDEIKLLRRGMQEGRIIPTHEMNTSYQADWAGDRYRLNSVPAWTLSFRIEQPDTGLAAKLTFHFTGRRATITTNLGGKLNLIRISRKHRNWQLRENSEVLLDLFWEDSKVEGTALLEENKVNRLYLLLIIFSLDRFYTRRWGGDYRR